MNALRYLTKPADEQKIRDVIDRVMKTISEDTHITSKADKALHGYGIGNIRRTVEKYGGMMRLSCAERVFTVEIILSK